MGFAKELSIVVPGRNEQFMRHTVDDVLAHSSEDTEVIAVCDGYWPDPALEDHPRLQSIHFSEPVGQRAATNAGASLSRAKYIMKLDAHCSVDDGFDVKMIEKMQPDWTMVPSMHRLHVFDWGCNECGERVYQGTQPKKCEECGHEEFYMHMVWQPRFNKGATVSWRFDQALHFQYWRKHHRRPEVKEQADTGIIETMSCIGCAFLMERERFWKLGGMDEGHGSWGQFGTELAAKAWLSGGKMVTCLDTFVAHLFRTGNFGRNGESSWPYPINQRQIDKARKHSRDLWLNNRWPKQKLPLSWLIEHFAPVPDWDDDALKKLKESEHDFVPAK
jgi:glycosyltransferase involved in cell wall biosynthesis